jgi:hypothetical protein
MLYTIIAVHYVCDNGFYYAKQKWCPYDDSIAIVNLTPETSCLASFDLVPFPPHYTW